MAESKRNRVDGDQFPSPFGVAKRDRAYFEELKRKLRRQLLGVYIVPLILLSVYFYFHYHRNLRQGIDNHLRSIADNQRNTVDLFLQERVANIRSLFRPGGVSADISEEKMLTTLDTLRRESGTFVDLGLFHPDGTLVAYAGPFPSLVGKSYRNEAWFKTLSEGDRDHFISDVYLGFRSHPHFIVAVQQNIEGAEWTLRASVDPEKFGDMVGGAYLVKDAEAFIVNRAGVLQTLPHEKREARRIPTPEPLSSETQIREYRLGENAYLGAIARLTLVDWALVVQVPIARANEPMRRAMWLLFAVLPAIILLIAVVVTRSTRRMVTRLEVATRAKETLQRQLFNAAKLASVGEIAAGVAHEINNPLAIIYEEAAMMKDVLDPSFHQRFELKNFNERLLAIEEAAIRGRAITRKLLAFSREHEPGQEPTDVNRLVDRVIRSREANFALSNLRVEREFSEPLPAVNAQQNELEQVMLNLLNNAKDAINDTGVITVRTRGSEKGVFVEVSDDGEGMPPEVMEQVFFPFFTTKEVGKGTGLGLSISYGIIKSLGGRIEIQSEPGMGTTVTVQLPAGGTPRPLSRTAVRGVS